MARRDGPGSRSVRSASSRIAPRRPSPRPTVPRPCPCRPGRRRRLARPSAFLRCPRDDWLDFPNLQEPLVAGQGRAPDEDETRLVGTEDHRVEVRGPALLAGIQAEENVDAAGREVEPEDSRRCRAGDLDRLSAPEVPGHLLVLGGDLEEARVEVAREIRCASPEPCLVVRPGITRTRLPVRTDRAEARRSGPIPERRDEPRRVLQVWRDDVIELLAARARPKARPDGIPVVAVDAGGVARRRLDFAQSALPDDPRP